MKKLYLATLVIAALMLITLPSSAQANLLDNASFESNGGAWTTPDWWSVDKTASAAGTINWGPTPVDGSWVFAVDQWGGGSAGSYGYAAQDVATGFNVGDAATLSMYVKTDAGYTGDAKLKLEFLGTGGTVLGTALSSEYGAGTDWTLATATGVIPVGTTSLKAYALSENMGVASTSAFFDAGSLDTASVPEPASLLLLGAGLVGLLGFKKVKK